MDFEELNPFDSSPWVREVHWPMAFKIEDYKHLVNGGEVPWDEPHPLCKDREDFLTGARVLSTSIGGV